LKAIRAVSAATEKKGIFALERGGDRAKIIIPLAGGGLRFVIRQDGDRHILLPSGKQCAIGRAAQYVFRQLPAGADNQFRGFWKWFRRADGRQVGRSQNIRREDLV